MHPDHLHTLWVRREARWPQSAWPAQQLGRQACRTCISQQAGRQGYYYLRVCACLLVHRGMHMSKADCTKKKKGAHAHARAEHDAHDVHLLPQAGAEPAQGG